MPTVAGARSGRFRRRWTRHFHNAQARAVEPRQVRICRRAAAFASLAKRCTCRCRNRLLERRCCMSWRTIACRGRPGHHTRAFWARHVDAADDHGTGGAVMLAGEGRSARRGKFKQLRRARSMCALLSAAEVRLIAVEQGRVYRGCWRGRISCSSRPGSRAIPSESRRLVRHGNDVAKPSS